MQFSVKEDPTNKRWYVLYKEGTSKTSQGGVRHRNVNGKEVRAYDNPDDKSRYFVALQEKYLAKCLTENRPEAFYLQPLGRVGAEDRCWFARQAVGHNTLKCICQEMCKSAKLQDPPRFMNHSLRRTVATRLYEFKQLITEVTGHRSNAVRKYKRTSAALQEKGSDILQGIVGRSRSSACSDNESFVRLARNDEALQNFGSGLDIGQITCTGGSVVVNIYKLN